MKKTLLTIAFLGAMTFASAQTTATFLSSGNAKQTFTVGKQSGDDINDSSIVSFTTATTDVDPDDAGITNAAIIASNNGFFGIITPYVETTAGGHLPINNTVTGAITFTLTTDSTTPITKEITLDMGKRPGVTVSGSISITGYADTPFNFLSNGTGDTSAQEIQSIFQTPIELVDSNPLTVVITINEFLNVDNTTVSGIVRLENVIVEDVATLSSETIDAATEAINISPNPTTGTFTLSSDDVVSVQIYDITGSLLKTYAPSTTYDISDLTSGVYMANVTTKTGSKTLKVVKN